MSSECAEYRQWIVARAAGDLDPDKEMPLARHLEECSGCSREQARIEETLHRLAELEEVAVPRHFFIEPQPSTSNPWWLWRQLTRPWRAGLAAASTALLLVAVLAVAQLQVEVGGGRLLVGFGALPETSGVSDERDAFEQELTQSVLAAVEARLVAHDTASRAALSLQAAELRADLEAYQGSALATLLAEHEKRQEQRWLARNEELRAAIQDFVLLSYDQLRREYRYDLAGVSQELDRFAAHDALQNRTMETLSAAFLQTSTRSFRNP